MSLVDRFRKMFAPRASYGTFDERAFLDNLRAASNSSGIYINEQTALQISAVWACVRVIAESIAMLPADIIEKSKGRREVLGNDHILSWLLNTTPDGEIGAFYWREALVAHALLWPGGYAEIERDMTGRPAALHLLTPDRVRAVRNESGELVYKIKTDDKGEAELPARNVFHLRGPSWNGTDAYSVVNLARQSLGLSAGMETFGASFFGNGAQLGTTYTTEQKLSTEQLGELRKKIEELHGSARNAFRPAILHSGLKVGETTMPLRESQFLEGRRFQVLEVARWFRVPPHLLGELERATHSNVEQEQLAFVTHTLLPWALRFEAEANLKLFGRNQQGRQTVKLNFGMLLRGDLKSRYEAYKIAREGGWYNADEIREFEDRNPLPDGQGQPYLVPTNMSLIRELEARADNAETPPPPAPAAVGADDEAISNELAALRTAISHLQPTIHITTPPTTAIVEAPIVNAHISVPERAVTVHAPDVRVNAPVSVSVPERAVTIDNHAAPVTVAPAVVNVTAEPAVVNLTVPEQAAPVVNVTMPKQRIDVAAPQVHLNQPRRIVETIERDSNNEMKRIVRETED